MVQLRWLWTVCFLTASGLLTVQSLQLSEKQDSPSEERDFYLPMKITNRVFNSTLLSPASEDYKTLYKEVNDLLDTIYECSNDSICPTEGFYGGVTNVAFSSGSVIANATVVFDTLSINPTIVHILLIRNAHNVQPQVLQLDLDYTTIDKIIQTMPGTTTAVPTTTTTPPTTPETTSATTMTTTPETTSTTTTTTTPETTSTTTTTTTPETTSATTTTTTPETTSTTTTTTTPETTSATTTTTTPATPETSTTAATTALTFTTIPVQDHTTVRGRPSQPQPSAGGSGSDASSDWVPGWGIALLVLASVAVLLLIIIFIMLVVHCCKKTENIQMVSAEDLYYTEKKQAPQQPLPVYSPQTPVTHSPGPAPILIEDAPKKNKSGFYAVNP